MRLECECGESGDESFYVNDQGDLVCAACGTQNFQQNRNEEQEYDDAFASGNFSGYGRISKKPRKNNSNKSKEKIYLSNCLHAVQHCLKSYVDALVDECYFPEQLKSLVKQLWFSFLHTWGVKGMRPLIQCFTIYIRKDNGLDRIQQHPNATGEIRIKSTRNERLQENTQNPLRFDRFCLRDLLGLCYLACRLLRMSILPKDLSILVNQGKIPFTQSFALLPLELREKLYPLREFFTKIVSCPGVYIAESTRYLAHNMDIDLPALNIPLVGYHLTKAYDLPNIVYLMFLRLIGVRKPYIGPLVSEPFDSAVMIAAHLIVAIKLCPSWHLWVQKYKRGADFLIPYNSSQLQKMKRGDLDTYLHYCTHTALLEESAPVFVKDHIRDLEDISNDSTVLKDQGLPSDITAFYPKYYGGKIRCSSPVRGDSTNAYFYPVYKKKSGNPSFHSSLEALISLFSEWIDGPTELLVIEVKKLDETLSSIIDFRKKNSKKKKIKE